MSPDGVSIVVSAFNEENFLPRLIPNLRQRLEELPDDVPTDVLVSDGGSSDRTVRIAKAASIVDGVISTNDGGVIDGRDKGIRAAEYDLQVHVDSDTVYHEGWLTNLLQPFAHDDTTVLSYGSVSGEGLETGSRELYALALRKLKGHYAPGQNRALSRNAYIQSPYRDTAQDAALITSLEEEVNFPNRMEQFGTVRYVPSASCTTSGRQLEEDLGFGSKDGGVNWKVNPEQIYNRVLG